jgi:hypothetical protein
MTLTQDYLCARNNRIEKVKTLKRANKALKSARNALQDMERKQKLGPGERIVLIYDNIIRAREEVVKEWEKKVEETENVEKLRKELQG